MRDLQAPQHPPAQATRELKLGANILPNSTCSFLVWAPNVGSIDLHLIAPEEKAIPLLPGDGGYYSAQIQGVGPGARYFYRVDGKDLPDPASRYQPESVHGPSEVVAPSFPWTDSTWRGLPLDDYIIYELHVGTFTSEGTFEAIISQLPELKRLGITAVELMPVAQFPGSRNWGYDGVDLFAVQNSYGGPAGLKRLVNACHEHGLAVILDVVYNHLGPDGNYLGKFGPYFNNAYRTPWGPALNFDGADSPEVRRFYIENALYWHDEFHVDALRLDAIHSIWDNSAIPFLQELAVAAERASKLRNVPFYLIAETDLNAPRFILPQIAGGYGLHAQWNDDFHHCLHVLLTGEKRGYYQDFGGVKQFAKVFREGYAYTGQYSKYRKARHGAPPRLTTLKQFVVCAQNHDQIGNRAAGDRLTALVQLDSLKLAAGAVILSPFIPLLFMGEEHAETAPFQYFTSHSDPQLIEAVRNGRREEFAIFGWTGEVPDPEAETTFTRSRIDHSLRQKGQHKLLFEFYRELIRLRRVHPVFAEASRDDIEVNVFEDEETLALKYSGQLLVALSFSKMIQRMPIDFANAEWDLELDSAAPQWGGAGSRLPEKIHPTAKRQIHLAPRSVVVYCRV